MKFLTIFYTFWWENLSLMLTSMMEKPCFVYEQISVFFIRLWYSLLYYFNFMKPIHVFENSVRKKFQRLGIEIGGKEPCDIQVYSPQFYSRLINDPIIALGETYMDVLWNPNEPEAFFNKLVSAQGLMKKDDKEPTGKNFGLHRFFQHPAMKFLGLTREKSYAFDTEMYQTLLDQSMSYCCGYWTKAKTLDEAQMDKMELMAQKLKLQPGMKILDIGCTWGGLALHLASKYDVKVVACTTSRDQYQVAKKRCEGFGIQIIQKSLDKIYGKFDRIISVGRFEFVKEEEYREFFEFVARCLKDDGLFLLHTVGVSHNYIQLIDPWYYNLLWAERYIFAGRPLSYPYHSHMTKYIEGLFILEDWQNMGHHYSKTMDCWLKNLENPKIQKKFGDKFYRMWKFYLYGSSASFRQRKLQVWELVFSRNGFEGGYDSFR